MSIAVDQPVAFDPRLVRCALCGSEELALFDHDSEGRTLDWCLGCGTRFLNPQYTDEHLRDLYARYTPEGDPDRERADHEQVHATYLELVESAVPRGRLLSVGCGGGVELSVARARGWQVEGYDVDPATVARVAGRLGLVIHSGDFFALDLPSQGFDCVYLHHVLEHPKAPARYLSRVHELLRPGGVLFIASPNVDSLSSRFKTLAGRLGLKARRGKHYDAWHHLFHYSPRTLAQLLERDFGFEVVEVTNGVRGRNRSRWAGPELRAALARALPPLSSIFVVLARRLG